MSALTITPEGTVLPAAFDATLASLPLTYAVPPNGGPADVAAIDGAEDWAAHARSAIERGARAIVVSNPRLVPAEDVRELAQLAEAHSASVEFAEWYAGDPVFDVHGEQLAAHLDASSVIILTEETAAVSKKQAIFGVLRATRRLGLQPEVTSVSETAASIALTGTAGGKTLFASVARTLVKPSLRIQCLGYMKTVDMELYGSLNARPAETTVTSMAGANRLPTVYETPERAAWRRVAATLRAGDSSWATLPGFVADLELVEQL